MSDCLDRPTESRVEAVWTSAWETVLKAGERDDANCNYEGAEDQQMEHGTAREGASYSIVTVLQALIPNEVKQHVGIPWAAILDVVEEAVERLFCTAALKELEN